LFYFENGTSEYKKTFILLLKYSHRQEPNGMDANQRKAFQRIGNTEKKDKRKDTELMVKVKCALDYGL
jgi:hypothetical protein